MNFGQWMKRRATGFDKAVYWPPIKRGNYSEPIPDDPVEINVMWDDTDVNYIDREGQVLTTDNVVYTLYNVELGGILFHGRLKDVIDFDNPLNNPGAVEIRKINSQSNFSNTVQQNTVYA